MTLIDEFLLTYSPRDEVIIRYRFGIKYAKKTDIEIINIIRHYAKGFNMSQLKRHYDFIEKSILDKSRKQYGVMFNCRSGEVYFTNPEMKQQFELYQAIQEIDNKTITEKYD